MGDEEVSKPTITEIPQTTDDLIDLVTAGRVASKVDKGLEVVGKDKDDPESREVFGRQVIARVKEFKIAMLRHPVSIFDEDLKYSSQGRIILDANGNFDQSGLVRPGSRQRVLSEYVTTAAAMASLYNENPDIPTSPPEGYRANLSALEKTVNGNNVSLIGGVANMSAGLKADVRFYQIPGQQLGPDKKPIPVQKQKVLVVQDAKLMDGKVIREYGISDAETISDEVDAYLEEQSGTKS